MSIKGYKGSLVEVAETLSGFKEKCESINLYSKLNDVEKLEEHFDSYNSNNMKYFYDKERDSLYKIDVESFQPSYCLSTFSDENSILFTSIFDTAGSSLENEIKKIIKKQHD